MFRYYDPQETQAKISESNTPESILKPSKTFRRRETFPKDKSKLSAVKKESLKKKQEKKRRIIIRNLSFKVDENDLKKILSKYGNVTDIKIPTKPDGMKRGFAFAQFDKFKNAVQAIKSLNFSKIMGRPIAIDFAIAKDKFETIKASKELKNDKPLHEESSEINSDSDNEDHSDDNKNITVDASSNQNTDEPSISDKDKKVDDFLKEFDFHTNSDDEAKNETDDSDSSDDDDNGNKDSGSVKNEDDESVEKSSPNSHKEQSKKSSSNDVQEGKTVFIRNIPFNTDQESFKEAMEEFGPVEYCLLCVDPLTELPRGTAFVKFKNKDDGEKLINKASNEMGNGVFYEHRKLHCSLALSRDEIKQKTDKGTKERKDKRNLKLLREGLIMTNSDEAKGVSEADLKKRAKLEMVKKQKLKNLNFFVSDTRLCVHNLPYEYTDEKLRKLFKQTVSSKAIIIEARIMKEMGKINADGKAKSKGFGFVTFTRHEDALEALHKLNNNSSIFTDQRRPIVEFSVESHLALLAKQRRRERNKQKNFKIRDENKSVNESQVGDEQQQQKMKPKNKKRKKKGQNKFSMQKQEGSGDTIHASKKIKETNVIEEITKELSHTSPKKKKSRNRKGKGQKRGMQTNEEQNFTDLVNQYKNKLLTKYNS